MFGGGDRELVQFGRPWPRRWYILADYGWHDMAGGGGTFTGDYW